MNSSIHDNKPVIVLASASPRRAELLEQIGLPFRCAVADVDEAPVDAESPGEYVERLALEKAHAVRGSLGTRLPVLGADTAVVLDNTIFGKPANHEHAREMLECLSGRTHTVLSAVALVDSRAQVQKSASQVTFRDIGRDEIAAYCRTGEPMGKAGAYAIQGRGAVFVQHLAGSYSGVMGLPLFETAGMLARAGVCIF